MARETDDLALSPELSAALPLKTAIASYLQAEGVRLTPKSLRGYGQTLRDLAEAFPRHRLDQFEPPEGSRIIDRFLNEKWGSRAPRTYNKHHSILHNFFLWNIRLGRIHGDPTAAISRAKTEMIQRDAFTDDERLAILRANPEVRDSVPLRLLFDYGVRKGDLQTLRFSDFDRRRRQVVYATRGVKRHSIEIIDDGFWTDLDQLKGEFGGRDDHYVLPKQRTTRRRPKRARQLAQLNSDLADLISRSARLETELMSPEAAAFVTKLQDALEVLHYTDEAAHTRTRHFPDKPSAEHGTHHWWYRCLARAGIVARGVTSGHGMHKARQTAGRRVLETTGNLKAVQTLLGLGSIRSAEDVYPEGGIDQLDATMRDLRRQLRPDA